MSDKYAELQLALDEFESQMALPLNERHPARQWWEHSCAVLLQDTGVMPQDLARRLKCNEGAVYANGAHAFLARLRDGIKPFPNFGWVG